MQAFCDRLLARRLLPRDGGRSGSEEVVSGFKKVVESEVDVINRRRELVAEGWLCKDRVVAENQLAKDHCDESVPSKTRWWKIHVDDRQPHEVKPSGTRDEREEPIPHLHSEQEIVGLACSGGGIRSAAFCLGVFQGLDSINPNNEKPQVLDAVDYLSTVSGGGYIATSVAVHLVQLQGRFAFESKLDAQETPGTKHIRDYSNYLAPEGLIDIVVGLVAIMRGLLINAMIFLGIILAVAAVTVFWNPNEGALRQPYAYFTGGAFPNSFPLTTVFIGLLLISQIGYAIIALRPRKRERPLTTLAQRESCRHRARDCPRPPVFCRACRLI